MLAKRTPCRWVVCLLICIFLPAGETYGANPKDLLNLKKIRKKLKLSSAQQDTARQKVDQIKDILTRFEWDYAKMTCEAAIWKGDRASLKVIKDRKKDAYTQVEDLLKTFRDGLGERQKRRLDKMMEGWEGLLDLQFNKDIPFYYIDTRPVFRNMENDRDVPYLNFTKPPSMASPERYRDVLKRWTARTYISTLTLGENQMPGISEAPELNIRSVGTSLEGNLVRSPLIISATLMAPDLVKAEIDHLNTYYKSEDQTLDELRKAYSEKNQVGDAILIRMKLTTPFAAPYLDLDNWIIYLEDNEGTGYEPADLKVVAIHPIEAIKIDVPGQTYEVTDVLGTYYPYVPGEKTYLTQGAAKFTYVGYEAQVKAFFPAYKLGGAPVISPRTKFLKLIIKPAKDRNFEGEAKWNFKRSRKS